MPICMPLCPKHDAKALSNGHSELKPKPMSVLIDCDGDCEVQEG